MPIDMLRGPRLVCYIWEVRVCGVKLASLFRHGQIVPNKYCKVFRYHVAFLPLFV